MCSTISNRINGISGRTLLTGFVAWILTIIFMDVVLQIGESTDNIKLSDAIAKPILIAVMVPVAIYVLLLVLGIIGMLLSCLCTPICWLFDVCLGLWMEDKEEKEPLINKKKKKKEDYDIV